MKDQVPEGQPWSNLTLAERYSVAVGGLDSHRQHDILAPLRRRLIASDSVAISVAIGIGLVVSSRQSAWEIDPLLAIYGVPVAIGLLWLAMLFLRGSYDQRFIGVGTDEVKQVLSGTLYTFAIVAGFGYLIRADISRSYAFVSLPLGVLMIVIARFSWRKWLYAQRYAGRFLFRTVVIGPKAAIHSLAKKLDEEAYVGYQVVGEVGPPPASGDLDQWLDAIVDALRRTQASAVAIEPGEQAPQDAVRQLAWRLDGRGIDLLISPGMLDVAGPRLSVRPAAGLPLLHIDEATLSRAQRFAKRSLDLVGSFVAIVVLSPLMLACAMAIRFSSPGPVIFSQRRIGRAGVPFTMYKFRSMRPEADSQRESLRSQLAYYSPMFKPADDPRITTVGKFLRRWSLDELPQLLNVLNGSMSLVGPRPHPVDDVQRYARDAFRRLALKPGMTGLWQVEGRSDLEWGKALQLDLYYVEHWSLATDLVLLARTVRAVGLGLGAR